MNYVTRFDSSTELPKNFYLSRQIKDTFRDIENTYNLAGTYTSIWNGLYYSGKQMPSGVYIVEINNQKSRSIKLVTLLK